MSAPGTTPGPWYVGEERHAARYQLVMASALHSGYVCEVQEHAGDMRATAYLIAAAPDLYGELEAVCEAIRELRLADGHATRTGDESRFDRAFQQICQHENRIRLLLARARGEKA